MSSHSYKPASNAAQPGRHDGRDHNCWYCGHTGGDPVKAAQVRANGNFLLSINAILLALLVLKVK